MANVFIDNITEFNQYDINEKENIIKSILNTREANLEKSFFLEYIPSSELSKFNFNDPSSRRQFKKMCYLPRLPIKTIGGCNFEGNMGNGIREYGIILSDPTEKIKGQFNITDNIMTYSPIFPYFDEQRDLIKFANDTYFTTIPFEIILMNQINYATDYYVHVGNYRKAHEVANYGVYILEKISKEQMIEYATNPELGNKVLKKSLFWK